MRPQSITFFCAILFFIGFSLAIRSLTQFFLVPGISTLFMLMISLIGLYCYYGLWHMKRWCIPLFFLVWGFLLVMQLLGSEQFTTINYLRSVYLIALLLIFSVVVLPQTSKLSGPWFWPMKI